MSSKATRNSEPALQPIFLVGMMGCGKSTIGRLLAENLARPFVDLDVEIERRESTSIPDLFTRGEAYFRACERAALLELCAEPGSPAAVVATGGGVPLRADNRAAMQTAGRPIYLEMSAAGLAARLMADGQRAKRPLLASVRGLPELEERLADLLRERRSSYEACGGRVNAEQSPSRLVAAICSILSQGDPEGLL